MDIYVVNVAYGQYEDYTTSNMKAFYKEEDAEKFVEKCQQANKIIVEIIDEMRNLPKDYFGKPYVCEEFPLFSQKPKVPFDHNLPTRDEEHKKRKKDYNSAIVKWTKEYSEWHDKQIKLLCKSQKVIDEHKEEYLKEKIAEKLDWTDFPYILRSHGINFEIETLELE